MVIFSVGIYCIQWLHPLGMKQFYFQLEIIKEFVLSRNKCRNYKCSILILRTTFLKQSGKKINSQHKLSHWTCWPVSYVHPGTLVHLSGWQSGVNLGCGWPTPPDKKTCLLGYFAESVCVIAFIFIWIRYNIPANVFTWISFILVQHPERPTLFKVHTQTLQLSQCSGLVGSCTHVSQMGILGSRVLGVVGTQPGWGWSCLGSPLIPRGW